MGPTPFRLELIWLEEKDLGGLIKSWWDNTTVEGWAGFKLSVKFKTLEGKIKEWAKCQFGDVRAVKDNILKEIQAVDNREEGGRLTLDEINRRLQLKDMFSRKVR